jgi:hypothetical protein
MDKKYTSLESTIRNVVRGNTGAAQDNRSLESKIRSVVLTESMAGYTAASERTENGHRAIVRDSEGRTRYAGGSEYPTKRHAINGANIFIRNGGGQDGSDMERDYNKQVMFQTHVEEVSINEAPDDAAPPGDGHLSVHELFGHLREYNEDHDRSTDPDDPDEESVKESRADINSTEKMIRKIHGQDTLDHVRNAIESERHIRLGTNPGVNNHQAVKDHLDAAVRASRHFSEALGTGGNESSENMKKEAYIITSSGRKPLINEAELEEGSEKFAKIMARTAAKKGEPITTDTTELEKKHDELLQTSREAADRAKQARTDYETLAKKYGITPEPIGEEVELDEEDLEEFFKIGKGGKAGGGRAAGRSGAQTPATAKAGKVSRLAGAAALGVGPDLVNALFRGNQGAGVVAPVDASDNDLTDRFELARNRHFAKERVNYGPEVHYKEDADAERSAIENVARPNSKNKLTKQTEIQRKIIEDTQRRKSVILRAKEENKNGKDGGNSDVETKPELKRVDVNEAEETGVWAAIKKGANKLNPIYDPNAPEYGATDLALDAASLAPGIGAPASATSAYRNLQRGDYGYAALDALGAVPLLGWAAKGAKAASLLSKAKTAGAIGGAGQVGYEVAKPDGVHSTIKDIQAQDGSSYGAAAGRVAAEIGSEVADTATKGYNDAKNWVAGKISGSDSNSAAANQPETPGQSGSKGGNSSGQVGTTVVAAKPGQSGSKGGNSSGQVGTTVVAAKESGSKVKSYKVPNSNSGNSQKTKSSAANIIKSVVAQSNRPAKSAAGSDYENARTAQLRANPNSVGARSALPPEARVEAPLPAAPVKAQPSPGINSTNTGVPRTMGSSFNNSYKNKYSMGPGPSQFPSK